MHYLRAKVVAARIQTYTLTLHGQHARTDKRSRWRLVYPAGASCRRHLFRGVILLCALGLDVMATLARGLSSSALSTSLYAMSGSYYAPNHTPWVTYGGCLGALRRVLCAHCGKAALGSQERRQPKDAWRRRNSWRGKGQSLFPFLSLAFYIYMYIF